MLSNAAVSTFLTSSFRKNFNATFSFEFVLCIPNSTTPNPPSPNCSPTLYIATDAGILSVHSSASSNGIIKSPPVDKYTSDSSSNIKISINSPPIDHNVIQGKSNVNYQERSGQKNGYVLPAPVKARVTFIMSTLRLAKVRNSSNDHSRSTTNPFPWFSTPTRSSPFALTYTFMRVTLIPENEERFPRSNIPRLPLSMTIFNEFLCLLLR